MQEEVENRTLTLTVNATKFTGRVLKAALSKYLAHRKNKKLQNSRDSPDDVKSYGRVSMEDLKKQYGDMKEIDLQDKGLRSFDRIAREYGVQYAVYKTAKGQYQIFFKAPSEASMNAAFPSTPAKKSKRRRKPSAPESVLGKLTQFKELVKAVVGPQPPEGAGTMKQLNVKKLVLLNLPYFLLGLFATNLGEAWRLATGADASAKMLWLLAPFCRCLSVAAAQLPSG